MRELDQGRIWKWIIIALETVLILGLMGSTLFLYHEIQQVKGPSLEELEELRESIVFLDLQLVYPESQKVESKIGTGLVVEIENQKYILSPYHILEMWGEEKISREFLEKHLQVFLFSGEGRGRRLEWQANPRAEVTVFKLPKDLNYPAMPIGDSDSLKEGQEIFQISFPEAEGMIIRNGNILSLEAAPHILVLLFQEGRTDLGANDVIRMSYPALAGESGAAILAFQDGKLKLVGIALGFISTKFQNVDIPIFSWGYKINTVLNQARDLIKKF